jgi:FixJ family two-component response regulator
VDFLQKPFSDDALLDAIAKAGAQPSPDSCSATSHASATTSREQLVHFELLSLRTADFLAIARTRAIMSPARMPSRTTEAMACRASSSSGG